MYCTNDGCYSFYPCPLHQQDIVRDRQLALMRLMEEFMNACLDQSLPFWIERDSWGDLREGNVSVLSQAITVAMQPGDRKSVV